VHARMTVSYILLDHSTRYRVVLSLVLNFKSMSKALNMHYLKS